MTAKLYYIHDPMCSWCWGFQPTWKEIKANLPSSIAIEYVVGGLAPDSNEPMPLETQQMIKGAWNRIQNMLGTEFNFDFWDNNTPRRSTYPTCRAVLSAKRQGMEMEMINAIQQGYYLHALNPSDDDVLIEFAKELNLDVDQFAQAINSSSIQNELKQQIELSRSLTQRGFPSLVLKHDGGYGFIDHDYKNWRISLNQIELFLSV